MTTVDIIIAHHHGVNGQFVYLWPRYVQAPDVMPLQKSVKLKYTRPGKAIEESFDAVRRCHLGQFRFNTAGITRIVSKLIEIGQMPTGAVRHEAQYSFEKFENRNSLFLFYKPLMLVFYLIKFFVDFLIKIFFYVKK